MKKRKIQKRNNSTFEVYSTVEYTEYRTRAYVMYTTPKLYDREMTWAI